MTERSAADDRTDEATEDLEAVRDRLSEFVDRGDESGEKRVNGPEPSESESDFGFEPGPESNLEFDSEARKHANEGNVGSGNGTSADDSSRGNLVVKSAVRNRIEGMAVAGDFYEPLNEAVGELLRDAARRTEANGRKTVQTRDL